MPDPQDKVVGVHLGTGGAPLILGLPVFALASVALGMGLIGAPAGIAVVAPIFIFVSGLYQFVTTGWAIILGQSLVAAIFGLFSGFWLSFAALMIGTHHGWYGIPPADLAASQELFFIAWTILFVFLTIPCLRLPVIYPVIVILVALALALAAAGSFFVAGIVVFIFDVLVWWSWMNVALTATGMTTVPPVGRPLW